MNESMARLVLEQAGDALIFADRDGKVVLWNRAATELFGYTADEVMGQGMDLIIPEHLRAAHWAGFHAAMKSGSLRLSGKPTVTRAQHKEGGKRYVEMTFALVKDTSGLAVGSVAMARDVTERIEKERAARQAQSSGRK